jgi:GAF domain-containing protein
MSDGADPVQESIAALSRFFIGDGSMGDTVQRVVELAERAVSASDMTGLTMLVEDKPTTAFFTDQAAPEIDQEQYRAGAGPCLDAFRDRAVYTIASTRDDTRWPDFCRAALDHGIESTMSLPLRAGEGAVGALNFYSRTRAAFSEETEEQGQLFADQAAIVLLNAQTYWDAFTLSERLNEALQSRAVIEQAKGILIAQSHVDADGAFAILVKASQRENRKLRDIATEMVERNIRRTASSSEG